MKKPVLTPGALHPITIEPTGARVTVRLGGRSVATSERSLSLREASYPRVVYVPLEDVEAGVLEPSSHTSYCPFKGEASYYDLRVGDDVVAAAAWTYPEPHEAVAEIRDHVAFYPDRVDAILVEGETGTSAG